MDDDKAQATVAVGSLRPGRIFLLDGRRFKLLYANASRAYVRPPALETVRVNGRAFKRRPQGWSISAGTLVEIPEKKRTKAGPVFP